MKNSKVGAAPANQEFSWSMHRLPIIMRATRAFLKDRNFETIYCSATIHALHLYDYDGEMYIGNRLVKLARGDITISPCGGKTLYNVPGDGGWHYCTHFAADNIESDASEIMLRLPLHFSAAADYTENELRFQEIIKLFALRQKSALAEFVAASEVRQFFLRLAIKANGVAACHEGVSPLEQKLKSVKNYIETALDQPLNIGCLAGKFEVSQNYLTQMFRKKYGMTIQRYILQRRIDKAKYLLETTAMSVKAIGAAVGLPDPQHFNKRFHLAADCSPSEFRNHLIHSADGERQREL